MKPYLLVSNDFVKTGGMDRANVALAEYLAQRGHEVHLVGYRMEDSLRRYPGVIFHGVPKILGRYIFSEPLLDRAGRFWANQITRRGGRVIVNGGNCCWNDVNWVHYVHAACAFQKEQKGLSWIRACLTNRFYQRSEIRALKQAAVVIANSQKTADELKNLLGISSQVTKLVYLGVEAEQFCEPTEEEKNSLRGKLGWSLEKPHVIFIGELNDNRKGFDVIFEVWRILCRDNHWDADLCVVGAGRELRCWKKKAIACGIESRVHFMGFRKDVPDLLKASDCFVSPARYESYGLTAHEAICCGIPSLISRDAGIAELYPPEFSDWLCENPEEVSFWIHRLKAWREHMAFYRKRVKPFTVRLRQNTWENMARNFLSAIGEIK